LETISSYPTARDPAEESVPVLLISSYNTPLDTKTLLSGLPGAFSSPG